MNTPTILDVMTTALGFAFGGADWNAWRVFLAAAFGLPMSEVQTDLYRHCTGRLASPATPAREAWMVVGRRGGKSRVAALIAVYLACFRRYHLAPGERGVVMVIAADRRQARVVHRYVRALIEGVPMLRALLAGEPTAESIRLTSGVDIEIHTASFRAVRGYTCVGVVADEIAFWPTDDAADPDREILAALRPSLATVPGALLIALSSPYARRGELWKTYTAHYGKEGSPVLVWQADTRTMHPAVDQAVIEAAYAEDEVAAASEYGAQFRRDLAPFVSRDLVDHCVERGCAERGAERRVRYIAFTDPSGGSSDSFTLAIGHRDSETAVLDVLREVRAPFDPSVVVGEFATVLHTYGVTHVSGDRYAGEWPREAFRKHGITYRTAEHPKSELYLHLLPMLTSGRARLLDHPRLVAQLTALERRTSRGGRDSIDHAPGGKDDVANAVAGALTSVGTLRRGVAYQAPIVNGSVDFGKARREAEARQDLPDPPPLPPASARYIDADGIVRGGATRWAQWEDLAPRPPTTRRRW